MSSFIRYGKICESFYSPMNHLKIDILCKHHVKDKYTKQFRECRNISLKNDKFCWRHSVKINKNDKFCWKHFNKIYDKKYDKWSYVI